MELSPFRPGTFLNRLPIAQKPANPSSKRIRVRVPARTHLSVIDMNHFSPGNPGGGGIGYAVKLYAEVEIELLEEKDYVIEAKREGVVRHVTSIIAQSVGYDKGFRIQAKDHNINHKGLGSTSALITATACGVNTLLGEPLDHRSLRRLIGYNFAEDAEGGMVLPGFETGVGPAAGIHGGFVVLADRLELIQQSSIPGTTVYLAFLKENVDESMGSVGTTRELGDEPGEENTTISESKNAGQLEAELLLNEAREGDTRDAHRKSHELLFHLLPSLKAGDIKAAGDSIWRLQHLGSKVAEINYHKSPERIYGVMEECRSRGARIVGMSSVGPAITVLCLKDDDIEASMEEYLESEDIGYMKTEVDNQGVVVKEL